ncbi:MAG: ParB N-terminal domain-containing protein, partial [Gammaproteobacteria bacterium]|nr:ParB N-terminal domain-containing protein [Gammaproteobacteria bacterium]
MPRRKYSYIHQDLQKLARPIEELTPDPKNARTHGDRNMSAIRGSLKEFGFRGAIIAQKSGDELIVRAGNGRLEAARQLGWSHVPVLVYSDDDKTSAAFALADNRTAELAAWDFEQIAGLIKEGALDEEIDIGFSSEEIQRILDGEILPLGESDSILDGEDAGEREGLTDPDEVPEAPEEPRTKTGDLWILGDHRLLCGDSTQADEVARLMDGEKACVVHADPPYGMGKEK